MMIVGPIEFDLSVQVDDVTRSFGSIGDVLAASGGFSQHLVELFPDVFCSLGEGGVDLRPDLSDLFVSQAVASPAGRTLESFFKPTERYIEFVTAIALDADAVIVFGRHGWPILSLGVGDAFSSVAEAGGASSLSGGCEGGAA